MTEEELDEIELEYGQLGWVEHPSWSERKRMDELFDVLTKFRWKKEGR